MCVYIGIHRKNTHVKMFKVNVPSREATFSSPSFVLSKFYTVSLKKFFELLTQSLNLLTDVSSIKIRLPGISGGQSGPAALGQPEPQQADRDEFSSCEWLTNR